VFFVKSSSNVIYLNSKTARRHTATTVSQAFVVDRRRSSFDVLFLPALQKYFEKDTRSGSDVDFVVQAARDVRKSLRHVIEKAHVPPGAFQVTAELL